MMDIILNNVLEVSTAACSQSHQSSRGIEMNRIVKGCMPVYLTCTARNAVSVVMWCQRNEDLLIVHENKRKDNY